MINAVRRCSKMYIGAVFLLLLLVMLRPAYAAPPDSGTAIQGVKPPAAQQPAGPAHVITVKGQAPTAEPGDGQKIAVSAFRIGGEPPVPESELLRLIDGEAGKELTLGELNGLADKITKYLRQKGFLVAFSYIPAQDINNGVVELAVAPGKYGQIKITGAARISPDRLKTMLFAASPGMIITRVPLERALLLVNDLSGVSVKATLTPGDAAGTADLVLEAADTASVSGAAYADNWGNTYTGRGRFGVQLVAGDISGQGDDLSIGGLISQNSRLTDYNLGYNLLAGNSGLRFGVNHFRMDYSLGESYAALGATGQATVTSYDLNYPFIRSRAFNLYANLGYVDKRLRDDLAASAVSSSKTSHLVNLGLAGNFADSWLGGGNNTFSLGCTFGRLNIKDAATAASDAITAQTAGGFTKTAFNWQRRQDLAENLDVSLNFTGQLADKNLDSSEKIFLGGADGVRAFPQGEAAGDDGYKLTGELSWRLTGLSGPKKDLYLNVFYDYGSVTVNHNPWAGAGDNRRSLMGAGLGLLWKNAPDLTLRLDYAWKIGREQTTADNDKNGRLWLQGVRYF